MTKLSRDFYSFFEEEKKQASSELQRKQKKRENLHGYTNTYSFSQAVLKKKEKEKYFRASDRQRQQIVLGGGGILGSKNVCQEAQVCVDGQKRKEVGTPQNGRREEE